MAFDGDGDSKLHNHFPTPSLPNTVPIILHWRFTTGGREQVSNGQEELSRAQNKLRSFQDLLSSMFLPVGYPHTVSPDYLRYQILNALQAFCNSLAGLISSRAILQGLGVGNPDATPTAALLLSILQDISSRLTTILSAYILGSSLHPEAKTYRILADILNDVAVVLDTISPLLVSAGAPGLRVPLLCLSASFKSLCGIAAGSKSAISLHFATPLTGKGDIGDLNAKDSSKETVLALFGMLLGTALVPRLTTTWATWSSLLLLVGLHLAINYLGVRGLVLRTFNRQRLSIAWMAYRSQSPSGACPNPSHVASLEGIFRRADTVRSAAHGSVIGRCSIGSSVSRVLDRPLPSELLELFNEERFLLWFDSRSLHSSSGHYRIISRPFIHIFFKDKYTQQDQLKAWILGTEICAAVANGNEKHNEMDPLAVIRRCLDIVKTNFADFIRSSQKVGWNTEESALIAAPPTVILNAVSSNTPRYETKKAQ
ncbi:hypothetical protein CVT24_001433 [Panaeolus cyanescens]|uniref:Protein root UVB sensitive/RUS domain-containing protein n=1 Tax=Panaeolus cyanescens TaxID=181874 RepID=A0A409W3B0_9AGAR|nr:hypothetical protein CVT24_001433 [Panaeolus cyanescens]